MLSYDYHRVTSLAEARALKDELTDARWIAGGTDVLVKLKRGDPGPSALISLRGLPELSRITVGDSVRIGASVTIRELLEHRTLAKTIPMLHEAARGIGSTQIRSVATIGGNLCNASPCADLAPPLLVLDAQMEILGQAGERSVPLADFMVAPRVHCMTSDEVLTGVRFVLPSSDWGGVFLKKKRVGMDLALVSMAAFIRLTSDGEVCQEARVAVGSAAPTPVRLTQLEAFLGGKPLTDGVIKEARRLASEGVSPISDVRASAHYRRHLAGVFAQRALEQLRLGRAA